MINSTIVIGTVAPKVIDILDGSTENGFKIMFADEILSLQFRARNATERELWKREINDAIKRYLPHID